MDSDANFADDALVDAHRHCTLNDEEISASSVCGCFYCLAICTAREITDWLDDRVHGIDGRTALCPKCGIDSVVGSASGYPITLAFLSAMRQRWFDR